MENYTPEVFIKNFLEDKEVFGEDTQYIYEEIFSAILEEKVDLTNFVNNIDSLLMGFKYNLIEMTQEEDTLTEDEKEEGLAIINELSTPLDIAKWAKQTIPNMDTVLSKGPNVTAWAKQVGPKGLEKLSTKLTAMGGIKGIFSKLKDKVFNFFGNLKGKSFGEIMNNGLAWLQNPANLTAALGTTGGVILIGLILKALKKRRKIKEYKKLQQLTRAGLMNEAFEEELNFDGSKKEFADAKNKVLAECRTNKALYNALYKEETKIEKQNYFDY